MKGGTAKGHAVSRLSPSRLACSDYDAHMFVMSSNVHSSLKV